MTNLTENDSFDSGVYEYQTTDAALGGPTGVMNTPLGNLANRTRYLLNRILDGVLKYVNDSGAVNAITISLPQPFPEGLIDGMEVSGRVAVTNTGAVTLAITNTGGPVIPTLPLYGGDNTNMVGNELPAGAIFRAKLNTSLNVANGGAWVLQWVTGGYNRISTPPVGDVTTKIANMAAIFSATDGLTTVNMAPAGNITLTPAQYGCAMINLSGALGAGNSKSLIFPTGQSGQWIVENDCTGASNVTAQTLGNAGVVLPVGVPTIIRSDGTTVKLVTAGGQAAINPIPVTGLAGSSYTVVGGYTPGALMIEKNGALLEPGTSSSPDFTATNGTTINFTLTVYVFSTFNVANAVQLSGGAMGGPLALYVGSTVSAPPALDNSSNVPSTAWVNGVGGCVGDSKNARMYIGAVSSTGTFAADELIVETALGGAPFRLSNISVAINLAGTNGAGAMDTGAAPASGFVATYVIYGPVVGYASLSVNANVKVPEVYGNGHMPSGYTASALVSIWPTTAAGKFIVGNLRGRRVSFAPIAGAALSAQASLTATSIASLVPINAYQCGGWMNSQTTTGTPSYIGMFAAADAAGTSEKYMVDQSAINCLESFDRLDIVTPQTIYYAATANPGPLTSVQMAISSYDF
jgi:hypothetical protein